MFNRLRFLNPAVKTKSKTVDTRIRAVSTLKKDRRYSNKWRGRTGTAPVAPSQNRRVVRFGVGRPSRRASLTDYIRDTFNVKPENISKVVNVPSPGHLRPAAADNGLSMAHLQADSAVSIMTSRMKILFTGRGLTLQKTMQNVNPTRFRAWKGQLLFLKTWHFRVFHTNTSCQVDKTFWVSWST